MKNVIGVLFADSHHASVSELTKIRPLGALPIAGRYRIIDFPLSNMVNSGIINVAVVTSNNYHSLMGHLGSGKQWNLARKRYGLMLFPPFSNLSSTGSDSRIDILYGILGFLKRSSQEYVLLSESNVISSKTFNKMYEKHLKSKSDITICYKEKSEFEKDNGDATYLITDNDDNVIDVVTGEDVKESNKRYFAACIVNKDVLIDFIEHSKVRGRKGYLTNLIGRNIGNLKIKAYKFEGYGRSIDSLEDYYNTNMELLNKDVRKVLFNNDNPIYTKDKDSCATIYKENAEVKNSLIADGCVIDGSVINSVVFRSAIIEKGALIKNSIVLQDCIIHKDVSLENVILDKKVEIGEGQKMLGLKEYPIVVEKGKKL